MKNIIKKFAIILAVVLLTISAKAQNTKSLKYEGVKQHFSHIVGNKINPMNHDLSFYMEKLSNFVKYQPNHTDISFYNAVDDAADLNSITNKLEKEVKFAPANHNEIELNSDSSADLLLLTQKLEQSIRYTPSNDIQMAGIQDNELEALTNIMAQELKFQPNNTID